MALHEVTQKSTAGGSLVAESTVLVFMALGTSSSARTVPEGEIMGIEVYLF